MLRLEFWTARKETRHVHFTVRRGWFQVSTACENCGKPSLTPLCPRCQEEDRRDFQTAREYLRKNPRASVAEVSAATGIPEHKFLRWVAKKWLEIRFSCSVCGKPITSGNICSKCASCLAPEKVTRVKMTGNFTSGDIHVLGVVQAISDGRMGMLKSRLTRREGKS